MTWSRLLILMKRVLRRCIGTDEVTNHVCIDPVCPHSLCFTTESPPINKYHGFSNIFSASLVSGSSIVLERVIHPFNLVCRGH